MRALGLHSRRAVRAAVGIGILRVDEHIRLLRERAGAVLAALAALAAAVRKLLLLLLLVMRMLLHCIVILRSVGRLRAAPAKLLLPLLMILRASRRGGRRRGSSG